ncbi:MAG: hypothetical protein P4L31_00515 [Candidatus Babeliales bacterium]|nr:hypothetical protein [Candidatus Babeliales bacterium]
MMIAKPRRPAKDIQMQETHLSGKNGPLWSHRPAISSTGLISAIWNHRRREGARPFAPFRDVAFCHGGLACVAVDARGHVVHLDLLQNRYYHVKHAGSPGVRVVCHPSKHDEAIVSFEDCSVRRGPVMRVCGSCWDDGGLKLM